MLSAAVRSVRRAARVLTAPFRAGTTSPVRRNPLGVERLEFRETPATFRWLGGWQNSDQAAIPQNWTTSPSAPYVRSTVAPTTGDVTLFDPAASNRDCFNLGAIPAGSYFDAVRLLPGYAGDVGAYGLTLTRDLWLDSAQATFTLQGDTSVDRYFKWTRGKLAGSGPTALRLIGGTAIIMPGAGNTLESTPRLSFEGNVTGTISTGTLRFMGDRTIKVAGTAAVSMTSLAVTTALANVEPVQVITVGPNDDPKLTAADVQANTALLVVGGLARIKGAAPVTFSAPVAAGDDASVKMLSGALVIDNGATLDSGGKNVDIDGGRLATAAVAAGNQPPATIKTKLLLGPV
ncbi:MAG: hypothetical protein K2X82_00145 [Gemmataceae bacterium]|nr:hypothetical protein [Gemmataceae bacterium]